MPRHRGRSSDLVTVESRSEQHVERAEAPDGRALTSRLCADFASPRQRLCSPQSLRWAGRACGGAVTGGAVPFVPGLSVFARMTSASLSLVGEVRGLEPAWPTASPPTVVTNISEGLMRVLPTHQEPWLAESMRSRCAHYSTRSKKASRYTTARKWTIDDVIARSRGCAIPRSPAPWLVLRPVDTIEASDDSTLTITLRAERAFQFV